MAADALHVEVVAADREVWRGDATNIIARTVEGDIGIMPGHEPLLALLVPCRVEVVGADGGRENLVVDGGFISVANNKVYVLSDTASLAEEISRDDAQRTVDELTPLHMRGELGEDQIHELRLAQAQLRAGEGS